MTNGGMRNSSHETLGTEHLHSRESPTLHPHRPSSPRLSQLRNDVTSASLIRFQNPQNAPPNLKIPTRPPPTTDKQYAQTPRGIFVTQQTRKRPSDEREPFLIPNAPSLSDPSPKNVCVLFRHFKRALCSLPPPGSFKFQALAFPRSKTHFVNLRLRLQKANFSDPERVRNIEALEGFLDYVTYRPVKLTFQPRFKIPAFLLRAFGSSGSP